MLRAVRNAAHVATATGVAMERGLVDDVLVAAWMVLRRHGDKVLAAACPWAYLMSSAQKQVLDEIRAHQLLTNTASIRGRAREVLPSIVRPVGATASDLATALRHEPSGTRLTGVSSVAILQRCAEPGLASDCAAPEKLRAVQPQVREPGRAPGRGPIAAVGSGQALRPEDGTFLRDPGTGVWHFRRSGDRAGVRRAVGLGEERRDRGTRRGGAVRQGTRVQRTSSRGRRRRTPARSSDPPPCATPGRSARLPGDEGASSRIAWAESVRISRGSTPSAIGSRPSHASRTGRWPPVARPSEGTPLRT